MDQAAVRSCMMPEMSILLHDGLCLHLDFYWISV